MDEASLAGEFSRQRTAYTEAANLVRRACEEIARALRIRDVLTSTAVFPEWPGLEGDSIGDGVTFSGRVKTADSVEGKVIDRDGRYGRLSDIPDLAGVRVVVDSQAYLPEFTRGLIGRFSVNWDHTTIGRNAIREVGYRSRHFVVSVDEALWEDFSRSSDRSAIGLHCEIQLRSLAAHTWAQAQRDLGVYKGGNVPRGLQRRLNLLAALLEFTDSELEEAREKRNAAQQVSADIAEPEKSSEEVTASELMDLMNHRLVADLCERASRVLGQPANTGFQEAEAREIATKLKALGIKELDIIVAAIVDFGPLVIEALSWPKVIPIADPEFLVVLCLAAAKPDQGPSLLSPFRAVAPEHIATILRRLAIFRPELY